MNRSIFILLAGLAVGSATHELYFRLHREGPGATHGGELGWMRSELGLSDDQYARIRELHESSGPRLRALSSQLAQMQAEFVAFENTRRTADRVDFIEFAHFVAARRAIDQAAFKQLIRVAVAANTSARAAKKK